MAVRIGVTLVDDASPDEKIEASVDASVLDRCQSQDDIRRVVGNLFIEMMREGMKAIAEMERDGTDFIVRSSETEAEL